MTEWFRQHRNSVILRMPWHIPDPEPTRLPMIGGHLAVCGTVVTIADRGIARMEDPPLDDRCAPCQGGWHRHSIAAG